MEQLNELKSRAKAPTKLAKNSKLLKTIIKAIQDKKGEDIVCIDLRKITESVSDFFIVCTARSNPQIKAIADNVDDEVTKNCNEKPYKQEGYTGQQWILIDYVNVVVHVMQPQARTFYRLEDMWSDADITAIND